MISGIGGGSYMYSTQMAAMRKPMGNPFEENDSNGDGSLDKVEITSFADKISEMTGQTVDVDQMISDLDADEDGLVSEEEFEAGRPQGPPPGMMGMMGGMQGHPGNPFEENDSNGDGSLDKDEITSFADKISEMTGQTVDVDQMISDLDADEDGLVSEEEFEAGRPEGPPPGMMGGMQPGGMQAGGIESLLNMLNSSENEDFSVSVDSLDLNGDGTIDADEAKTGISYLIQEYLNQMTETSDQDSENAGLLDLQV
jgi:Ca2+-binding EF-hand superfamily protein